MHANFYNLIKEDGKMHTETKKVYLRILIVYNFVDKERTDV